MSVFDLKKGDSAIISSLNLSGSILSRLSSIGISVGRKITVLSFSLFKGSVLVGCGAVRLGIRSTLAKSIEVEKC